MHNIGTWVITGATALLVASSTLAGCGDVRIDEAAGVERSAIPAGYYASADASSGDALRISLHGIIADHQWFPYTSTATDTWDILEAADEDPNNAANVLDVYLNASYAKVGGGNTDYNREHSWPRSYGFPNDGTSNYPHNDCHALFIVNDSYNSSRGNNIYDDCDASCAEKPTEVNNLQGGGTGIYPGNSNWRSSTVWETWNGRRGDVARALLYLDVRYEGGTHGVSGAPEPDLILTDDPALIVVTSGNASVAYMGMRNTLIAWHHEDPPDATEMHRNDVVYSYQGNRNPFIDHPEWVDCVFENVCDASSGSGGTGGSGGTSGSGGEGGSSGGAGGGSPVCIIDGVCDVSGGESCSSCPDDCVTAAACGNGVCETADGEDCVSCPVDCNGVQSGNPSKRFCCGDGDGESPVSCGDSRCTSNGYACSAQAAPSACCGDSVCEGGESSNNCSYDCGAAPWCGDGSCNGSENSCSCAADCGAAPSSEASCGNGLDDDCDGNVDCNDTDCGGSASCQCTPVGGACNSDSECCSSSCKGKTGSKTCK